MMDALITHMGYVPQPPAPTVTPNHHQRNADPEALTSLVDAWKRLGYPDSWRAFSTNLPNHMYKTPLDAFCSQILNGDYPPPEIMLSVAKCFSLYFEAGGRLSLEEIFFGSTKQGAGTFAKRAFRDRLFHVFYDTVRRDTEWSEAAGKKRKSLDKIAEVFLRSYDDCSAIEGLDVDSFLRSYRRWKAETFRDTDK